ncbi:MAG: ABC transporter permease [Rhodospirillales bacterium]
MTIDAGTATPGAARRKRGLAPITQRRLAAFWRNRRAVGSLLVFGVVFVFALFAEFVANDRPLLVSYEGKLYFPIFNDYDEVTFGGDLPIQADFTDPAIAQHIEEKGWMVWPLIPYDYRSIVTGLNSSPPTPPSWRNWLGTDDQSRDVMARVIYGFRISVLFGLTLTLLSSVIGVFAGAIQGYFGGAVDLLFQRFMEIWSGMPTLYILIIMASILVPGFWMLLGLMLLFSWMGLVGLVRAEFLRTRNFDYVRAARALGVRDFAIIRRHILPNALTATLTFLPFIVSGATVALTSLDFLGLGLPPGSPSLGELLLQGKNNLQAPWLGLTGFFSVAIMLTLLVFIGEGVRDAFNPRKTMH